MNVCEYRWMASRPEVPTQPVHHVCIRDEGHDVWHGCSCGAVTQVVSEKDEPPAAEKV